MSEFKPITTQEEFESRLLERLEQKERSVAKKFESYTSPDDLETIKADYQKQIDDLNHSIKEKEEKYAGYDETIKGYESKIADYETDSVKTRVAIDMGLPLKLKDRLRGKTEEEIREDAKALSSLVQKRSAPLSSVDPVYSKEDEKKLKLDESYKKFIRNL